MTAVLALDAVSVSVWRGDHQLKVLRRVSLVVSAGEFAAVYGKGGAGKTTLLKVAAGLLAPDQGRVFLEGEDVYEGGSISRRLERHQIGWASRMAPQRPELPALTQVALPLYRRYGARRARLRAMSALERVGAHDRADEAWIDLPDTDRALVGIAQAVARQPRLLLVDDPTYGVGVTDRAVLGGVLRDIAESNGAAVLMAVPDVSAAMHAHTTHLLHNGRLVGGAPADAVEHANVVHLRRRGH